MNKILESTNIDFLNKQFFDLNDDKFLNLMSIANSVFHLPELFHFPFFYDEGVKDDNNESAENLNLAYFVQCKEKDSSLMKFDFKVWGVNVACVIDTGASTVFVSKDFIYKLLRENIDLKIEKLVGSVNVTLGNGESVECDKRVLIPLQIEGSVYETYALILERLPFEMILGTSFLYDNDVLIRPSTKSIVIDSDFGVKLNESKQNESFLFLKEDVFLPAFSECMVATKCNNKKFKTGFVKTSNELSERASIYVGKGIIENADDIQIVIGNLSSRPSSLPKGTIVAKLSCMELDDCTIHLTMLDSNDTVSNISDDSKTCIPDKLDLSNTSLNELELHKIKKLITKYNHLFSISGKAVSCTSDVTHTIDTGDCRPINQVPYHASNGERGIIEEQISEMLRNKVISYSKSPWASCVVLVKKKDGTIRFCVDYRRLNKITKKDVYPLPRIDDCLNALGRAKYFSTFDLASGYWQIPMNKQDKEKTAFVSHCGLFEFNVMPFGLCNAPATFQRFMDKCFAGLKWSSCLIYLDDIIVFSSTFEEHLRDLENVFKRLEEAGLTLKPSKCYICQKKLIYLGHEISAEGIGPDPNKVKAIKDMRVPQNKTELRSYLGMCSYYRKFITDFAKIASPLHQLTHDDCEFTWIDKHQEAYNQLKSRLINPPILSHPNFDFPFIIQTDASYEGLGAVLCQNIDGKERVIQYISRTLQSNEGKWCTREIEALGIIFACETFRPYIIGTKFLIETDHESLTWLQEAKSPARLVRWSLRLSEFDFEIRHKRGLANCNADGLSRLPVANTYEISSDNLESYFMMVKSKTNIEISNEVNEIDFAKEQKQDLLLRPIYCILHKTPTKETKHYFDIYELRNSVIYRKSTDKYGPRLVIPQHLREMILEKHHNDILSAHVGRDRVYGMICKRYYWLGMSDDIRRYVNSCLDCNKRKPPQPLVNGELVPVKATYPFEIVSIDIMGPFKTTPRQNKYILVCVDVFTNWVEAAPIKYKEAEDVCEALFKLIITQHGSPKKFLTDQGTQFTSKLFKSLCDKLNIQKI